MGPEKKQALRERERERSREGGGKENEKKIC